MLIKRTRGSPVACLPHLSSSELFLGADCSSTGTLLGEPREEPLAREGEVGPIYTRLNSFPRRGMYLMFSANKLLQDWTNDEPKVSDQTDPGTDRSQVWTGGFVVLEVSKGCGRSLLPQRRARR